MTINEYMTEFAGLPVRDWTSEEGIAGPETEAYRIGVTWDEEANDGIFWTDKFSEFLEDANVGKVVALVSRMLGTSSASRGARRCSGGSRGACCRQR